MNEADLKKALQQIKNVRMGKEEKEKMLMRIYTKNPVPVFRNREYSWHAFSVWTRQYGWVTTLSLLMVFTMTGRGMAKAAYHALPGDALYSFKVNIVEPLKGNLLASLPERANYQIELIMDRLNETELLASDGRLEALGREQILSLIGQHMDQLAIDLGLGHDKNSEVVAEAIKVNFKNELHTKVKILEAISTTTPQGIIANDIANTVVKKADEMFMSVPANR